MPPRKKRLPTDLSLAEIRRLLQIKKRMVPLEERKGELEKELARIQANLESLRRGALSGRGVRRKKVRRKKATRKKVARKKAARKVAKKAGRRVAKKAGRRVAKKTVKKVARKVGRKKVRQVGRKTVRKKTRRKVAKKGRAAAAQKGKPTLEGVVAHLIRQNGKPLPFQTILATIVKKRLVSTKSKNFANVLRRTLSTSKTIKRKGRGIYGLA
jgi:hypothetical protein